MASITIRKLDERLKKDLRKQAAENGRSLEAEAREILKSGVRKSPDKQETGAAFFDRIHRRFMKYGGVDLQLPKRQESRSSRIPNFARDDLQWPDE
jgi:plasmid stability protein